MTIKHGIYGEMTPTEQMLSDAHSLLEEINNDFFLIRKYPYLDEDRSAARELHKRIEEFMKRPLYESEAP